ncbi:multidrug effflux MFS transporter [Afifella sp. YEN Y35]|uniref:multidrug effflux MFS transporter n=1 Tax=Afifella sp. YEN Y35 TaxID=3388337 RepID=UPI0039E13961
MSGRGLQEAERRGKTSEAPPPVWLLVLVTATGPLALHILVGAVPGLQRSFGGDYGRLQLTLTVFLAGIGVAQLGYGLLSERFGRRPVLLAGLGLYTVASAACAFAPSIEILLVCRTLQAVGGCAGMVMSRAIVRDLFGRSRSASLYGYITMAMALAPAVSPTIGSYFDLWLSWRWSFVFLSLFGVAATVGAACLLPETRRATSELDLSGWFRAYGRLAIRPAFLAYSLNTAFTMAAWYTFIAGMPFILVEVEGLPQSTYGLLVMLVLSAYATGNFLSGRFSARLGSDRMIFGGGIVSLVGACLFTAVAESGAGGPLVWFLVMSVNVLGNGITQPNGIASALSIDPPRAGAAAGFLGLLQMAVAGLATVFVLQLGTPSVLRLAVSILVLILASHVAFAVALWTGRGTPDLPHAE